MAGGGNGCADNDTVDFENVWQAQIYLISMESLIVGEHRTGIFSLITWIVWFLFRCVAHGKNKNRSKTCVSKMSRHFNFFVIRRRSIAQKKSNGINSGALFPVWQSQYIRFQFVFSIERISWYNSIWFRAVYSRLIFPFFVRFMLRHAAPCAILSGNLLHSMF